MRQNIDIQTEHNQRCGARTLRHPDRGAGSAGVILGVIVVVLLIIGVWIWKSRNATENNTPNPVVNTSVSTAATTPGVNPGVTNLPGGGAINTAGSVAGAVTSQAEQQLRP